MVFTVEYSVRGAMREAYELFGVNKRIPAIHHELLDPRDGLKTFRVHLQVAVAGADLMERPTVR